MSHAKPCWSWVIAVAVSLATFVLSQDNSSSVNSVATQAALRAVVENFFAAYAKEDLVAMMTLWSEKSPDFATHKQS